MERHSKEWWMKMAELEDDSEVGVGSLTGPKTVLILSGISGSGKTTYAQKLQKENPDAVRVSADNYFMSPTGDYRFDVTILGEAHAACYRAFKFFLAAGVDLIIVDNTNTTIREMKGYMNLAAEAGYAVRNMYFPCDPE